MGVGIRLHMCTSMYWICIFLSLCVHLLFQSWITVLCVWPQNEMSHCIITIIQLVKIAFLIYQLQPLYHHQWSKGKADIFYACCALNVTAWYLQTLLNFKKLFPIIFICWSPPPSYSLTSTPKSSSSTATRPATLIPFACLLLPSNF